MYKKFILIASFVVTSLNTSFGQFTLVKDISPATGRGVALNAKPVIHNGEFYFVGHQDGYSRTLWRTDGTTTGTQNVVPSTTAVEVDYLCSSGTKFYFTGYADAPALFVLNTAGTGATKIRTFTNGDPFDLVALGDGKAIFGVESFNDIFSQLWVTEGTLATTQKLGDDLLNNGFMHYFKYQNTMLITEQSTNTEQSPAILTDGTTAGTQKVVDYLTPLVGPIYKLQSVVAADDLLFFTIQVESSPGFLTNKEYVTDGTITGTIEIDISGFLTDAFNVGGKYVLIGENEVGVCDSITKTYSVLSNAPNYFNNPIQHKNKVYFHGNNDKIYATDGTLSGTSNILSLPSSSLSFDPFLFANGDTLFVAYIKNVNATFKSVNLLTNQSADFVNLGISGFQLEYPLIGSLNDNILFARSTTDYDYEIWRFGNISSAASEAEVPSLKAFPNPTNDFLSLDFDSPFSGQIQILDVIGNVILEQNALKNIQKHQIIVKKWPSGFYFLNTISDSGERTVLRVLVGAY